MAVNVKFQNQLWSNATIKKVSDIIKHYSYINAGKLESINMSSEDFQQEILAKLCHQNGYNNYKPEKKGFRGYIWLVCYRTLGDNVRKKFLGKAIPDPIYMNAPLNEEGFTIGDTLASDEAINTGIINNFIGMVPNENIFENIEYTYRNLLIELISKNSREICAQWNIELEAQNKYNTTELSLNKKRLKELQIEYNMLEKSGNRFNELTDEQKLDYLEEMEQLTNIINLKKTIINNLSLKTKLKIKHCDLVIEIEELRDYIKYNYAI